ncbi:membrane protein [Arthrobacter phage Wollypog]|uniref:Membrane protein n=1 Tax=Arthrobacter phage Wollypog TaxID=2790985 RepID=A0A7T3KCB2_9CAUD|nr:membrane protein [Arthrobacter phage Wollypog]QPX62636.1 membrane protein [Arthrobacter phage Wollypog]
MGLMETYLPTLTVAGVLGFLAPLLSTALSKLTWKPQVKQLVAVLVSVAMAVVALLVTNGFAPPQEGQDPVVYWILIAFAVIAVSQLAFSLVWRPTEVEAKIAVATASAKELETFQQMNTLPEATTVDSTSAHIAEKVSEVEGQDAYGDPLSENPDRVPGPDHRADGPVG